MEINAILKRLMIQSKRRPIVLIAGLFQPFIWLFLFSAVFKNSPLAQLSGADSYLGFITPGALVFTAFTGALNGGVPLLFDRELGFLNRMLVAPLVSRSSILWASGIHIFLMSLLQCVVLLSVSALMGVAFQGGLMGWVGMLLILVAITIIFTTFSLILAFGLRYHFELLSLIMIVSLPMVFLSTAFAPLEYMPVWLRNVVCLNPISLAVSSMREIFFHANWTWNTVLFEGCMIPWTLGQCLIALSVVAVLLQFLAKPVFNRKLQ